MCEHTGVKTMADRLTVVFDDHTLYRRLKVRAAEEGVPVKRIIEEALQRYLGPEDGARVFDFQAFRRWQAEIDEVPVDESVPGDLSDVKRHLYGYPEREEHSAPLLIAEESVEYDAR